MRTPLRDAVERIDYGLTTSATDVPNGPKFLRITDIVGGSLDWQTVPWCEAADKEREKYRLQTGDIVIARTGATTGASAWIRVDPEEEAVFASYLVRLRANADFDSRFLGYVLKTRAWTAYVEGVAHGKSAQPNMSAASMADFEFSQPPLAEQRAIAEVLGALDDKIEANRKLAATADHLAGSLLSPVESSVPLRQVATQSKVSLNPQSLNDEVVAHYSLPAFDDGAGPEMVAAASIKSNKYHLQKPAVLVSKLNPRFPRVWNVADLAQDVALASTEFVILEPTGCSTHVLWAMTQHTRFARSLQGLVAGTSGSHQRVRPAEILETLVPDPREVPMEVQSRVDAIVRRSLAASKENRSLVAVRDTLLPKLMSGQLRVKEVMAVAAL